MVRNHPQRFGIAIAGVALFALSACSPELRGRSCETDSDCLLSEQCNDGTCEARTGLGDAESDGDYQTDATPDTASDLGSDVSSDSSNDADIADSGEPVACTETEQRFAHSVPLTLFEPCEPPSPAWPACLGDDGLAGGDAYSSLRSSWVRTDEPVEVVLQNGWVEDGVSHFPLHQDDLSQTGDLASSVVMAETDIEWDFVEGFDGRELGAILLPSPAGTASEGIAFSPTSSSLGSMTVAFWIRLSELPDADSTLLQIIGNRSLILSWYDGRLRAVARGGSPEPLTGEIELDPPVERWTHVAVVTQGGAEPSLYVNGRFQEMGWSGEITGDDPPQRLVIGGTLDRDCERPCGLRAAVDDLLFVDRPLSNLQLTAIAQSRRPFGSRLVEAGADYDDLRLVRRDLEGRVVVVATDIVGRRPFPLSDDAIFHWPFEDDYAERGGATPTLDNVGNLSSGRFGGRQSGSSAVELSGGGRIRTGASVDNQLTLTVEAWIRPRGPDGAILGWREPDGDGELSLAIVDQRLVGRLFVAGGDGLEITHSADNLTNDRWHHVAFGYVQDIPDGGRQGTLVGLGVDGAWETESTSMAGFHINDSGLDVHIGSINDNADSSPIPRFSGRIDEVRIHTRPFVEANEAVWPPVPVLRFEVSTAPENEDGDEPNPLSSYWLVWGNEAVGPAVFERSPETASFTRGSCTRLWGRCDGYQGYWVFDGAGAATDRSLQTTTFRSRGPSSNNPTNVRTALGNGLHFDGSQLAELGTFEIWADLSLTVEVLMRGEVDQSEGTVLRFERRVEGEECAFGRLRFGQGGDGLEHSGLLFEIDDGSCALPTRFGSLGAIEPVPILRAAVSHWLGSADIVMFTNQMYQRLLDNEGPPSYQPTEEPRVRERVAVSIGADPSHIGPSDGLVGDVIAVRLMNGALGPDQLLHVPMLDWRLEDRDDGPICLPAPESETD